MSNLFSYYEGSLEDFLTYITGIEDNRLVKIKLSPISTLEDIGIINDSFIHVLDNFAVKHILHRHGGKRESLRGQIPVTISDLLLIPIIFSSFDSRSLGKCNNGNLAIIYAKDIDDVSYTLVEEVRTGHSELATSTLYKRKRKLTDAKSPRDSADSGFASFLKETHRRKELNSAISGFVPAAKVSKYPQIPNKSLISISYVQTNLHSSSHRLSAAGTGRTGSWP